MHKKVNRILSFALLLFIISNAKSEDIENTIKKKYEEAYKIKEDPKYKEFFNQKVQKVPENIEKDIKVKVDENLDKAKQDFMNQRNEIDKSEGWEDLKNYVYYLFISSSIPKPTLYRYVEDISIYNSKNKNKIVMLLRGCVDSKDCKTIKPTIEFSKDLLTLGSTQNKGLPNVEIWIEPFKFREYSVNKVPCLANKLTKKIVCGDYKIDYMITTTSK